MPAPRTLLLGISGPSSSGKTTLSRLLRSILPSSFILHLDDFYLADGDIPVGADGLQDWDCLESLDLTGFERALRYIKEHGGSPPELVSKEDRNAIGGSGVSGEEIEGWRERLKGDEGWRELLGLSGDAEGGEPVKVAIIDGFLLYAEGMLTIRSLFDIKLFLPTTREITKQRREARQGYVTIEGFWEDPPGYVDKIVWPNYVRDHAFLFQDGDVDGAIDEERCKSVGVQVMPRAYGNDMSKCLAWALETLQVELKQSKI